LAGQLRAFLHFGMKGRPIIVAAILLAMFMSAMEATVVATAMPTAVAELGGLELYGWVGAVYMLATTVTIPLFGKLADTAGRKPVALWGIGIFLVGSLGSGLAPSMPLLIAARAIQGIGAGAMGPVSLTIIGDLFTPAERARIQGLFGAVWGIAGMSGPLLGGLIVNALSWRWVFYVNIPFGLLSALILSVRYEQPKAKGTRRPLDGWGALFLSGAVLLLLLGTSGTRPYLTIAGSAACFALFIRTENSHPDPVLPLGLMARRLISVASIQSAAIGAVLTGTTLFVPLWVQAVLHGTATQGGTAVAPMLIGWPIASAMSSRILLRTGTRALVRAGAIVMAVATIGMDLSIAHAASPWWVRALTFTMGVGMGLSNTALIISVQESVEFRERGVATATTLFFRTIGGALAVGAMGAILAWVIAGRVSEEMLDDILGPDRGRSLDPKSVERVSGVLAEGIRTTFHIVAATGIISAVTALLFPRTVLEPRRQEAESTASVTS
jgi:EmrB/QacA subfamily drug resistance transporter